MALEVRRADEEFARHQLAYELKHGKKVPTTPRASHPAGAPPQEPVIRRGHEKLAAKGGTPLLPITKLCCASEGMLEAFGGAAQLPLTTRAMARMSLGWLSLWSDDEAMRGRSRVG